MDEFEGFPNAPFEDGFQWLQCTLWRWISMTAWAIVSIHNYERTETKSWDKLVQSKLFALNANVHSSSQPVTLAHRKDDCFMTSLAPWCNNSTGWRIKHDQEYGWIVLEFFLFTYSTFNILMKTREEVGEFFPVPFLCYWPLLSKNV